MPNSSTAQLVIEVFIFLLILDVCSVDFFHQRFFYWCICIFYFFWEGGGDLFISVFIVYLLMDVKLNFSHNFKYHGALTFSENSHKTSRRSFGWDNFKFFSTWRLVQYRKDAINNCKTLKFFELNIRHF